METERNIDHPALFGGLLMIASALFVLVFTQDTSAAIVAITLGLSLYATWELRQHQRIAGLWAPRGHLPFGVACGLLSAPNLATRYAVQD